jgi:hypothetical protein
MTDLVWRRAGGDGAGLAIRCGGGGRGKRRLPYNRWPLAACNAPGNGKLMCF